MSTTGALAIVKFLEDQGVRIVAGIPGGSILPLYDALSRSRLIRHVLARHEQGAAFMAQGMARLTGRPGVCLATSGPGATNLVTAIADAHRDGVPLVCLTGQVPSSLLGTEAFQEVDIVAITKPVTKLSRQVKRAAELPQALAEAFRLAASGRPGPVLLDIPRDVQCETMEDPGPAVSAPPAVPAPNGWDASRAAAMINSAKRPVLLLGGGAARGLAPQYALALAERASIPVTMTLMGLGAVPATHPLSLGMHGMHGHVWANQALDQCDLLIAVGSRFDDRAVGTPETFCPGARIIHINLDPSEHGRVKRADLALASDSAQALAAILPLAERRERSSWLAEIARFKSEAPSGGVADCPGCARGVIAEAAAMLDADDVIVTDVGQHQMFVAQSFPFSTPGRFLTSGGLGVMGFGLPSALGAALARPEGRVVLFTGDGSLKMNVQELATLAETGANVKIVVLDNQSLGLVSQQQALFFGGNRTASRYGRGTDFAALAQAFGVDAVDLDASPDRESAMREALDRPGPALIHVRVDREAMVFPMVPPGASNRDMLHSRPGEIAHDLPKAANME